MSTFDEDLFLEGLKCFRVARKVLEEAGKLGRLEWLAE